MTAIRFPFRDYPTWRRPGKPARFDGMATIELGETPRLPVADANGKTMKSPPLPLQYSLRFIVGEITLHGYVIGMAEIRDDVERYIRGRYWPSIQCLLFAEFMRESDLPDYADVYFALGTAR